MRSRIDKLIVVAQLNQLPSRKGWACVPANVSRRVLALTILGHGHSFQLAELGRDHTLYKTESVMMFEQVKLRKSAEGG